MPNWAKIIKIACQFNSWYYYSNLIAFNSEKQFGAQNYNSFERLQYGMYMQVHI